MFGKKELGIMGAAALAACSPEKESQGVASREDTVFMEDENGDMVITIPDEIAPQEMAPQYTPEQIDQMLSGTTAEVDTMTKEQIEQLGKE